MKQQTKDAIKEASVAGCGMVLISFGVLLIKEGSLSYGITCIIIGLLLLGIGKWLSW